MSRLRADLAHEAGEVNREGFFRTQSGMIHQERGDARAAATAFAAAADSMEGTPASLQHRVALTGAMLACAKLAEPANVIRYGERALALAHDDADAAPGLHNVVGNAYAALGNGTRAVHHFACGATLARAAGNTALEARFTAQIAQVSAPSS